MPVSTAYATLPDFLALPELDSAKPHDDTFIEALLERCSREFDGDTGYWFYADVQTRRYDVPRGRCLELDAPLLAVERITNGDDTHLPASEYILTPYNGVHKTAVELYADSVYNWELSSNARRQGVIYVLGTWGYVDRSSTDPESRMVVQNTKSAVLDLALTLYKGRYGQHVEGVARVTAAGVVITPRDKSAYYMSVVQRYRRIT